jgi:hypothetical protein
MENPAQLGDPCFVVGNGVSGIDNCDIGLFCWDTFGDNQGYCTAHCTGPVEDPTCPQGFDCALYAVGFSLCYETCNPLLQSCSLESNICGFNGSTFLCSGPSGEDIAAHGACTFYHSCAPGLACVPSVAAIECDPSIFACCEPFCDTTLPNTCPGQDQTCIPWYDPGDAPPGLESVGLCSLP